MEGWFGIRCGEADVMGWNTVRDAVSWISSRLQPVPFDEAHPPEEMKADLELDRLFDELNPIPWGPGRFIRFSEIGPSTPCWCGSGRRYFDCCGVFWRPKAGFGKGKRRFRVLKGGAEGLRGDGQAPFRRQDPGAIPHGPAPPG